MLLFFLSSFWMLIKSMYWNDKKMFFKHVLDDDSPSSSSCLFLRNSSFLFCSLKKKHIHFLMSNSIMKINNTRRHLQTNYCCCTYLWFIWIANTSKTLDSSVLEHHTKDESICNIGKEERYFKDYSIYLILSPPLFISLFL